MPAPLPAPVQFDLPAHALRPPPRGMYTFFNPYHAPTQAREHSFPQFAPYRYSAAAPQPGARGVDASFLPPPRVAKLEPPSKRARKGSGGGGGGGGGAGAGASAGDAYVSLLMSDFAN